ncbi:tRNA(Ile)-lysidine synthase [Nocardioides psychrotolerans]|uniref:tRNA(Ile)-lysidine synthase n=1 Tax=Nocardioides psychrotolerans TaxID=1005945 RepID=A0A1I3MYJ3_9ACTN|nr:tRNA lysidine(34) synthetase TilS [Nocardioides psychrotolerans]GEP39065.1 tRNA(Ile)-lysidine synthase [Nocardioides psychrotolerans]SFJ02174.1 tRNA(Ile)-lysidine synthase [Nocardioides psychrotolerans]
MSLDPAVAAVRLAVRRTLAEVDLPAGRSVVVACSGGADSLALLAATVFETRRMPQRVIGVIVDHGLQDGSAEHTASVVAQMIRLGADETGSVRVQVETDGHGTEAAAREARYAVLEEIAGRLGAGTVLLGHTLDDQAETALLGLARGSGGRSIAGMRPGFGVFRRPLLGIRRAQTEAACAAEDITSWTDPHNSDPRFTRARVRHSVLPVLERELGPGVAETLARTAEQLRPDMAALDRLADAALARHLHAGAGTRTGPGFDVREVADLEQAVRTRMLRLAALSAGCPPSELFAVHVDALEQQVHNHEKLPKQIQLPGHVTAYRQGDHLWFGATSVES